MLIAVGIAPIRKTPETPSRISERVWSSAVRSASTRCPQRSTSSPSGVSPSNR